MPLIIDLCIKPAIENLSPGGLKFEAQHPVS